MAGSDKKVEVSIVLRTVDRASAKMAAINEALEKRFKPLANFTEQLGKLYEHSGLGKIAAGFKGIGTEVTGAVKQIAAAAGVLGGLAAGATAGFLHIVEQADELGDTAEKVGVTADALYQLRAAAEASGSSAEELDAGMSTFVKTLGQVDAKTGKLYGFLKKVSPELLKQVKGAKSTEEAFDLMADAIASIEDPQRRAALAAVAFGSAGVGLAPLLAKGSKSIDAMREATLKNAGSQQAAVDAADKVKKAMGPLHQSFDGLKNQIIVGLAPAFVELANKATTFLTKNRAQIGEWIKNFGEKIPAAVNKVIDVVSGVVHAMEPVVGVIGGFVDAVGGGENAVKLLIAAWIAFKGLKILVHLGEITGGVWKMVTALKAAEAATIAESAAAAAGGAGAAAAGGAAAAAAGPGKGLGLLGLVPFIGAAGGAYGLVKAATGNVSKEQLEAGARRAGEGFSDADLEGLPGVVGDRIREQRAKDRAAAAAARERSAAAAVRGSVGPSLADAPLTDATIKQLADALTKGGIITVDFTNAPPGTRVEKKKDGGGLVDLAVGYLLGAP